MTSAVSDKTLNSKIGTLIFTLCGIFLDKLLTLDKDGMLKTISFQTQLRGIYFVKNT